MRDVTLTVSSDCLLENIDLDLEKIIKDELTIENPKYIAAKRYGRWIGKRLKPQLKYYDPVPNGIRFPRGWSNKAVLLCREHIGTSPVIIDKRRTLDDIPLLFHGNLRDYQEKAVAKIVSHSFGVLEAGTGSGKTVMALSVIAQRKQPTLILVHTKELLYQWRDRVGEFLGFPAGLIGDGHKEIKEVTIAIVNSARKMAKKLAPKFGHLVVDECHRVPATLFTDVVSVFDCQFLLGLSATAFRSDDQTTKLIYFYMGDPLYKVEQHELTASGAIVKPRIMVQKTGFEYGYRGDYQALITALTNHEARNVQIIEDIEREASRGEGTALVVSDRVSHCRIFESSLLKRGIRVELLTGQTTTENRSRIVEDVQNGEVKVLVATLQLISEGFDCPGLNSLFLTTPITFEGRLVQVIGRIMRPAKDKEARVYDYLDYQVSPLRKSANIRHRVLRKIMEPKLDETLT